MKISLQEFKDRSEKIHKDADGRPIYDYSKSVIDGAHSKVIIICKRCGREFTQSAWHHLNGYGCRVCNLDNVKKLLSSNTYDFIKKSELVHQKKYDYSDVNYINRQIKVTIKCKNCGTSFEQTPSSHLSGSGCPVCAKIDRYKIRKSTQDFINQAENIHQDKFGNPLFDYSKSNYIGSYKNITIICKKCGREFVQRSSHHLNGCGCPFCIKSDGEKKLEKLLFNNKINYISQYKFKDCKNIKQLPFDFYLPDENICIEFDGIQHFEERTGMGGYDRFVIQKVNDKIKNKYCSDNGITLFRIKYNSNLNNKFSEILDFIKNKKSYEI